MVWVAGVDGCRGGWFRVCRETGSGQLGFDLLARADELWGSAPYPRVVAIDMPIGLPEAGTRACDREARALLGPRRSSVFPAPIRAALVASDREQASRITQAIDGRGVSAQAFGIHPKIQEIDASLGRRRDRRAKDRGVVVREVHPELTFREWNGGTPMTHAKRTREGHLERRRLVETWLGADVLASARAVPAGGVHPKQHLADDDILDAIATLWTAQRILDGRARRVPADPPVDAAGLAMEIVF